MNIEQMRQLDRYGGGIICLILEVYYRFWRVLKRVWCFLGKKSKERPVTKVLVIKFFGMGSIALMFPMINAIKKKYPSAKILFLTFFQNKEICELLKVGDEILCVYPQKVRRLLLEVCGIFIRLWKERVDICFDVEFFSRLSAVVSFLSLAKQRVGYASSFAWRGRLLTHPTYFNHYRHIKEVFLALVKRVDPAIPQNIYQFPVVKIKKREKEEENLLILLKKKNVYSFKNLIGINVNSSEMCLERRWPAERFAKLAAFLQKTGVFTIVFVGSSKERDYVQRTIDLLPNKQRMVNLSGELNLSQLFILLKNLTLFITNDSGPLHFAEILDTPTVSFFGPETPILYGPKGKKHFIFYAGVYCSPCLNVYDGKKVRCRDNICMKAISVEKVKNKIAEILKI
jgi:ADP-heptose:LPS heptosyltransferase